MKKLFVFGDVHSFYNELKIALDEAGFDIDNKNHCVISLGDMIDRGPDSRKVLNFLNKHPRDRKVCVIGNHELLMEDMIARGYPDGVDKSNGTLGTAEQLTYITGHPESAILDMSANEIWNKYKATWQWYFELDKYIFVHGWIPYGEVSKWGSRISDEYNPDWRDVSVRDWENATWENGMEAWSEGVREKGKTIFCGHWHTSWGHANLHNWGKEFLNEVETMHYSEELGRMVPFADYSPFVDENIVALDSCTALTHLVNVWTIEIEDEEWNRWKLKF